MGAGSVIPQRSAVAGAVADEWHAAARRIADDLVVMMGSSTEHQSLAIAVGPQLAGGLAGVSLFLWNAAAAFEDEQYRTAAERALRRAIEGLADAEMGMGLFSGFTGVAWLTHAVRESGLLSRDQQSSSDPCAQVDEVLLEYLGGDAAWLPFDLLDGVAGIAVYALDRMPRPTAVSLLHECVKRLRASALVTPRGIVWQVRRDGLPDYARETYPEGTFPLGVAHGLAGVIGVLARIVSEVPQLPDAMELFEGALSFLLSSRLPPGSMGTFPRLANLDGPLGERSEMTWCWGDPGVAAMMLMAARALSRQSLGDIATQTMESAAGLHPVVSEMSDACLCHGWSGIAGIFSRFHEQVPTGPFGAAAQRWYAPVFRTAVHDDGIGGMYFRLPRPPGVEMVPSPGVLMGSAGVGLSLLSAWSTCSVPWDRCFLMNCR